MGKYEAGKWPPYNVKAIEQNIRLVMRTGDIKKLNGKTYHFITQHMGFIAHYDLGGFRDEYRNVEELKHKLQTSEMSLDLDYNLRWADKCEMDHQFVQWYGEAYCRSNAEGIRAIVAVARNGS